MCISDGKTLHRSWAEDGAALLLSLHSLGVLWRQVQGVEAHRAEVQRGKDKLLQHRSEQNFTWQRDSSYVIERYVVFN